MEKAPEAGGMEAEQRMNKREEKLSLLKAGGSVGLGEKMRSRPAGQNGGRWAVSAAGLDLSTEGGRVHCFLNEDHSWGA